MLESGGEGGGEFLPGKSRIGGEWGGGETKVRSPVSVLFERRLDRQGQWLQQSHCLSNLIGV